MPSFQLGAGLCLLLLLAPAAAEALARPSVTLDVPAPRR